jgi:hypothetical protein
MRAKARFSQHGKACGAYMPPCISRSMCALQAVRQALEAGAPLPAARTLVGPVWNAPGDEFPGLYCNALPEQPFLPAPEGRQGRGCLPSTSPSATTIFRIMRREVG